MKMKIKIVGENRLGDDLLKHFTSSLNDTLEHVATEETNVMKAIPD